MNDERESVATKPRRRRLDDLAIEATGEESVRQEPKRGLENVLVKTQRFLSDKIKAALSEKGTAKVAIFTHPCPDPDAIGSQMGLSWLLHKAYEGIEVDCFYDGHISHPQNQRMCNLLDPELKIYTDCQPKEYDLCVSVDTVPAHASCPENTVFDLVIDHHREIPNGGFKGLFLNLKGGSCCATIYQLIKAYGLGFEEDNDSDSKVATALLVGIITDTEYQTSDDTTELEHEAYGELFDFRNSAHLKEITRYKQPREWVQARACVAQKAHDRIKDGVLIHGIGYITGNNRDLIAAVADEMLSWENVETAVAFAVVDGDRIEGSVRSMNAALAVPTLCKELGCALGGTGGGKLGKGAYSYALGSCSNDGEMDESIKDKLWEFINERELKRLYKIIKK
jgi:nanoRNase/pAp phosphatase (c-di-AMP/oligoRNAs hydrolase)